MKKEIFLNTDRAYELDTRIAKRMPEGFADNIMSEATYRVATRAAVIALQEYERMKAESQEE